MKTRILLCLVSWTLSVASAQNFITHTYTATDGLPSNYLFSVTQDSRGYLWFGTLYGVSKCNGSFFRNFGVELQLPSMTVRRILPDSKGNIWIGSQTGMVRFANQKADQFPLDDREEIKFTFEVQETPEGKIWWLTDKGVYQFEEDHWKKLTRNSKAFFARQVAFMNGQMYHSEGDRIVISGPGGESTIENTKASYDPYYRILRKCNNRIFVSTNYSVHEIVNNQLVPRFASLLNESKHIFVYWYLLDKSNRMWLATDRGLWISHPGSEEIAQEIDMDFAVTSDILEDKLGNVWLATSNGLMRASNSHSVFYDFPSHKISSAFVSRSGEFYLGMADDKIHNSGLFKFQNGNLTGTITSAALSEELIDSYTEDENECIWLTTRRGYIYKVCEEKPIRMHHQAPTGALLTAISYDRQKKLVYVASQQLMLLREEAQGRLQTVKTFKAIEEPVGIFRDSRNNLWVGTSSGNIFYVSGDSIRRMNDQLEIQPFRSTGKPIFAEDGQGHLWISVPGYAIRKYHWEHDMVKFDFAITTQVGLPNDFIKAMVVDGKNSLWAISDTGPVHIQVDNVSPNGVLIADLNPYIPGEHDWSLAGLQKLKDHRIAVHTSHGVFIFDENSDYSVPPPETRIEFLSVRDVTSTALKDSVIERPRGQLSLSYHQNSLFFQYEAVSLAMHLHYYSFRLLGADSSWSQPSRNGTATFPGLRPGQYTFQVRSRFMNSAWSEPDSVSFVIQPPFWQTWWFRAAVTISVIAVVVGALAWYIERIKSKQRVLNQLADLELRALKSQMSPHFVFNAMNSIQSLIADEKPAIALRYMSKFSKLLRTVLENSEKNFISLQKEINSLDLYVQIEALRLNFDLDYTIQVDDAISPDFEMIPPMIVQPYVENALWHGLSTKAGDRQLRIRFGVEDDLLFCEIEDNGIGRKKSAEVKNQTEPEHSSKGQSITEKRLMLINQWDRSSVQITDLYNKDGTAAGTRVVLKLSRNSVSRRAKVI